MWPLNTNLIFVCYSDHGWLIKHVFFKRFTQKFNQQEIIKMNGINSLLAATKAENGITTDDLMMRLALTGGILLLAGIIICFCQGCRNGPTNASRGLFSVPTGANDEKAGAAVKEEQMRPLLPT